MTGWLESTERWCLVRLVTLRPSLRGGMLRSGTTPNPADSDDMWPSRRVNDSAFESVADIGTVHSRAEREYAGFERALDGCAIVKKGVGDANTECSAIGAMPMTSNINLPVLPVRSYIMTEHEDYSDLDGDEKVCGNRD